MIFKYSEEGAAHAHAHVLEGEEGAAPVLEEQGDLKYSDVEESAAPVWEEEGS